MKPYYLKILVLIISVLGIVALVRSYSWMKISNARGEEVFDDFFRTGTFTSIEGVELEIREIEGGYSIKFSERKEGGRSFEKIIEKRGKGEFKTELGAIKYNLKRRTMKSWGE